VKTTKEQRERILKIFHGAAWNLEEGQFTLHGFFKEIDSLESLVHRQAELLERCKRFVKIAEDNYSEGAEQLLKDLEALGEE
jgi:hypothetical protein